jgi:hypothetical protein
MWQPGVMESASRWRFAWGRFDFLATGTKSQVLPV